MKQVAGMVVDEAKEVLNDYQAEHDIKQQGEAIGSLLLKYVAITEELDRLKAEQKELMQSPAETST